MGGGGLKFLGSIVTTDGSSTKINVRLAIVRQVMVSFHRNRGP